MTWMPVVTRPCIAVRPGGAGTVQRDLAEETPVAVVFDGTSHAVMMASPVDLVDFAHGFALSEGIVTELAQIEACEIADHRLGIEARLWLRADRRAALDARRRFLSGPVGCGLCGLDSLEAATRPLPPVPASGVSFAQTEVTRASGAVRARQPLQDRTRATHAAGFLQPRRGITRVREDVGRHNALDKLIGAISRAGLDPSIGGFVVTSRLSTELIQKCAMVGCPVLIGVSAPTAHAVRLAEDAGITLVACARDDAFDVHTHPHRVQTGVADVA